MTLFINTAQQQLKQNCVQFAIPGTVIKINHSIIPYLTAAIECWG